MRHGCVQWDGNKFSTKEQAMECIRQKKASLQSLMKMTSQSIIVTNYTSIIQKFGNLVMDFGWEHHAAVVLFGESENGCVYLLKEYSSKHKNIDGWIDIINKIQKHTGEITVYCDSARPDLINDMQCAGINARNAHKDVIAGIGEVATMFKNRRLYIVRENVSRFDEEIDTYCWKEGADEPVKVNDDVMDAMRYGVYSERVEREEAAELNESEYLDMGW